MRKLDKKSMFSFYAFAVAIVAIGAIVVVMMTLAMNKKNDPYVINSSTVVYDAQNNLLLRRSGTANTTLPLRRGTAITSENRSSPTREIPDR